MNALDKFDSWEAVLAHVAAGLPVYYQAPLDMRATWVDVAPRARGKLRVIPPSSCEADPFTADSGHLNRFRKRAPSIPREPEAMEDE